MYPQPYHYWRWACKYYPILLNPLHNVALTHLPEAPTFTSGFAGASARVAASGKVLIYKADSGLVWWARWPWGLRSYWPEETRALVVLGGGWLTRGSEEGEDGEGGVLPNSALSLFLLFFSSLSPPFLSSTLSLALSEGALMRIPLISWGLTGTQTTLHLIPPSPPLGQQEAPRSTAAPSRALRTIPVRYQADIHLLIYWPAWELVALSY